MGISGYSYKEWKGEGLFYPPKVSTANFLKYYATRYNTLESVGSFTHMPSEATVERWLDTLPEGFRIAPKMHQKVTHFTRLKPTGYEAAHAFVDALRPVEEAGKLGPTLIQLRPDFKRDDDLLRAFLAQLTERTSLPLAIEFRNASWSCPEVEAILRERNVAWAVVETDEDNAEFHDTASFRYVRLRKLAYSDDELRKWSETFRQTVDSGKDCYVFCRHDQVPEPWKWADRIIGLAGS